MRLGWLCGLVALVAVGRVGAEELPGQAPVQTVDAMEELPDAGPRAPPPLGITLETPSEPRGLDYAAPSTCETLPGGVTVHVQCDDKARVCLVSSTHELESDGKDSDREAERLNWCNGVNSPATALVARQQGGYRLLRATAEAPPGWVRDERNRVMQFNFDMHRRVWIGGGYAPGLTVVGGTVTQRQDGEAEVGFRADWVSDSGERLYRLHLLEGRLEPAKGLFEGTAFQLDYSQLNETPVVRITTFFGKPRRFDPSLNLGWWLQAGRVETDARANPTQLYVTIVSAAPTLDLVDSKSRESYFRLRAGPALSYESVSKRYFFAPFAGADFEAILDADGFHRFYGNAQFDFLLGAETTSGPLAAAPRYPSRFHADVGYELILLAINDQPLSAMAEVRTAYRNDRVGSPDGWDLSGVVGLRFSFWAPPRVGAPTRAPTGTANYTTSAASPR